MVDKEDEIYREDIVSNSPILTVAFPCLTPVSLTPVEEQNLLDNVSAYSSVPPTFTKPIEDVEDMVGRDRKVYAASDSTPVSLEHFRLHSAAGQSNERFAMMTDPPAPTDIGMSNLTPQHHHDDRQEHSDTLNRTLHQCARDGDDESLSALLEHLGDRTRKLINKWDDNKMNPLHYAARYNHFRIVEILVEHGANVKHWGEDHQTALHYAAKYKKAKAMKKSATTDNAAEADAEAEEEDSSSFPKIQVSETTELGSDTEEPGPETPMLETDAEQSNGHTTIYLGGAGDAPKPEEETKATRGMVQSVTTEDVVDLAAYKVAEDSVIAYLVKHDAEPNAMDAYGSTPLHFAAMRDNETALLDLLCMKGIDIEAMDKQRMRPLHLAATHDNKECCRLLILKGAELRAVDDENSTPLHMAATEGNTEVVKMLFEQAEQLDSWVTIQNMITDQDQENNTPLHLAVENGHYDVVKLCLDKNANVNKPRQNFVTPLHLAAISGDIRIVQTLVEHKARINALDGDQATALHRATAYDNDEVIEYLVKKHTRLEKADKDNFTALLIAASNGHVKSLKMLIKLGADIMVTDKIERTALHWAAQENQPEIIKALLHNKVGNELLDANDMYGNTPLHTAAQKGYIECVKLLLEFDADIEDKNDEEQAPLHLAAQSGMTHIVKLLTQVDKSTINDYDENSNTPLHLAALEGHTKVAAVLLDRGADIAARNCTQWTPIDCAAAQGRVKMIRCLLEYDSPIDPIDKVRTTPLHLACKHGHPECAALLIDKGADVNVVTSSGYNCMDLAIDNGNKDVVQAILNSDKWFEAMKHAYRDLEGHDGMRITPMRKLIRKMPDLAENVFAQCTTTNDYPPESNKFQITFNYELLDDQYASWESEDGSSKSGESSLFGGSVYGDDNKVLEEKQPYSSHKSIIKKNHPMLIMVQSAREDLLAHPLVTSLLRHKWHTVGRYFYYINLILYLVYLIFITGFALSVPSPVSLVTRGFNLSEIETEEALKNVSCAAQASIYDSQTHTALVIAGKKVFVEFGIWISIIVIAVKLLSEVFQFINAKWSYIGYENILEWILYVTSLLFVIPFSNNCIRFRERWQWETGSVAVFLAWMELILIIRKLPRFGIYVVMFTHILNTFMQFFVVFFLFLIGFSISFYMLLGNQTPFDSVEDSLLKTAIMMIGEFEFDTIFNDPGNATYYKGASYVIFVIFIVVMSILIMNLLVGLAVDDIKGVQEQAVLTRMAMQIELALTVESMLPEFITKKHIMKCLKVRPNQYKNACARQCGGGAGAVISGMDSSNLAAALNPELEDIEKVMEEQEHLKVQVGKLNSRTKELRTQNERMESMLQALLAHHSIDFTDVDHDEDDDMDLANVFK